MKPAPGQFDRHAAGETPYEPASRGWLGCLTATVLSMTFTCRMLTPTDAAALGETLWIAQLSLVALILWVVAEYWTGWLQLQFDWIDAAVLLLCLGPMIGALVVVATSGDKRAALDMFWEWCGVGATFFLMRRVVRTSADRQSLLLVVAASAVSLSGLGLWQHYGGYAQSRRTYETLKTELETLERQGPPADSRGAAAWNRAVQRARAEFVRMGIPSDAAARMQWEQRLNSSEPIGLFALTNTLAGILALAAIVWLGLLVDAVRTAPPWQIACGAFCTALILYCLLLTKSRTAYVGLLAGLATLIAGRGIYGTGSQRGVRGRRLLGGLAAGLLAAILLTTVAYATGGLDRLVVSESAKSLRYRIEYWQATCEMLADSPRNWLLGVGPGNFRQHYLRFKLPQSSEEIADPHNMVLDVLSSGGLVALAGLGGVCVAGLRPLWKGKKAVPAEQPGLLPGRNFILAGGVLGHLAVLVPGGGGDEATVLLLLLGWLAVVATCSGLFRNALSPVVSAAAFAAMLVHLLGAGGIGMPAVVQLWLLAAAFSAAAEPPACLTFATNDRRPMVVAGLVGLALYAGCWLTGVIPVIAARNAIARGEYELFEQRRPAKAEREFRRAAEADPWSSKPCELLAQVAFQSWVAATDAGPAAFERIVALQNEEIARNPRHFGAYQALGEMYLAKFARTRAADDAAEAVAAFGHAAALYPHQARLQSQLAEALWKSGGEEAALVAARRACALDEINERAGHLDKRLSAQRRKMMDQIVQECLRKGELTHAPSGLK